MMFQGWASGIFILFSCFWLKKGQNLDFFHSIRILIKSIKIAYLAVFMSKNSIITICPPLKHHKNTLEIIFGHFQTISDPKLRIRSNTSQNDQKMSPLNL